MKSFHLSLVLTFGLSDLRIIEPSDYRTFGQSRTFAHSSVPFKPVLVLSLSARLSW